MQSAFKSSSPPACNNLITLPSVLAPSLFLFSSCLKTHSSSFKGHQMSLPLCSFPLPLPKSCKENPPPPLAKELCNCPYSWLFYTCLTLFYSQFIFLNICKHIFNGTVIALQCCVTFCSIAMWIGHVYISPPSWVSLQPPPPPHPSRSSQSWAQLPVLYVSFPLALCFTHGHAFVSIFIFQFIQLFLLHPHPTHVYACLFT